MKTIFAKWCRNNVGSVFQSLYDILSYVTVLYLRQKWIEIEWNEVVNYILFNCPNIGCVKQVLGKVYAVLSNKDQRAVYDEQGVVDEELDSLNQDRSWEEYWRRLFPKVCYW